DRQYPAAGAYHLLAALRWPGRGSSRSGSRAWARIDRTVAVHVHVVTVLRIFTIGVDADIGLDIDLGGLDGGLDGVEVGLGLEYGLGLDDDLGLAIRLGPGPVRSAHPGRDQEPCPDGNDG